MTWKVPPFLLPIGRSTGTGRLRMVSLTSKDDACRSGHIVYAKWCDKHNYTWKFENNKYYGVPYETDPLIFQEGVELFYGQDLQRQGKRVSG